jgi:cytochrome c2
MRTPFIGLAALVLVMSACSHEERERYAALLTGGSPERGRSAIQRYGCGACHDIPGVPGARARVGPPLGGVGGRAYIAGVLANTPDNMIRWIQTPKAIDSKTAMPELGVTLRDARDIAGYLYSLQN